MSFRFLFWILMLLWLLFGLWVNWGAARFGYYAGGHLLEFVLFVLLGWKVFGKPIEP